MRPDALAGANKADRRACPLRPLRIPGKMFLRNVDIALPLPAADVTGSEHGANSSERACEGVQLVCQKAFVCVAAAMEAVAEPADLVGTGGSAGGATIAGSVDCSRTPPVARTAASILPRTFRARRVRFTSARSTLAPVVRMRERAVGPSASSSATHSTAKLPKIAPAMEESIHCHEAPPRAASSEAGIISRHSHIRLGHTMMYSRSRR